MISSHISMQWQSAAAQQLLLVDFPAYQPTSRVAQSSSYLHAAVVGQGSVVPQTDPDVQRHSFCTAVCVYQPKRLFCSLEAHEPSRLPPHARVLAKCGLMSLA